MGIPSDRNKKTFLSDKVGAWFIPFAGEHAARISNVDLDAMSQDANVLATSLLNLLDLYDLDGLSIGFCSTPMDINHIARTAKYVSDQVRPGSRLVVGLLPGPIGHGDCPLVLEPAYPVESSSEIKNGFKALRQDVNTLSNMLDILVVYEPDLERVSDELFKEEFDKRFTTICNIIAYYERTSGIYGGKLSPSRAAALRQCGFDLLLVQPGDYDSVWNQTELQEAFIGLCISPEHFFGDIADIQAYASELRLQTNSSRAFLFTLGEIPADVPVENLRSFVRTLKGTA
jgi:hypothetical protein